MLAGVAHTPAITNLLAVLGPGGSVVGGVIGWMIRPVDWRQAFENLALGATAGGVCGCLVAFMVYVGAKVAGG